MSQFALNEARGLATRLGDHNSIILMSMIIDALEQCEDVINTTNVFCNKGALVFVERRDERNLHSLKFFCQTKMGVTFQIITECRPMFTGPDDDDMVWNGDMIVVRAENYKRPFSAVDGHSYPKALHLSDIFTDSHKIQWFLMDMAEYYDNQYQAMYLTKPSS